MTAVIIPATISARDEKGDDGRNPDMFLKFELSADTVYSDEQVTAVLYLYSNCELEDINFGELKLPADCEVIDNHYPYDMQVRKQDGHNYYVYRLKVYTVSPSRGGSFQIRSPQIELTYLTKRTVVYGYRAYRRQDSHNVKLKPVAVKLYVLPGTNPDIDRRRFPVSTAMIQMVPAGNKCKHLFAQATLSRDGYFAVTDYQ